MSYVGQHSRKAINLPTTEGAYALLFSECPSEDYIVPGAVEEPLMVQDALEHHEVQATVGVFDKNDELYGAVVATGYVSAHNVFTPDGEYLEIGLSWPNVQAWGKAQQDFLKERARMQCIINFASAAAELAQRHTCAAPVLTFLGPWSSESLPVRRKMVQAFLQKTLVVAEIA